MKKIQTKINLTYGQNTGNFGISHNGVLVAAPQLADKVVVDELANYKLVNTSVIEGFIEIGYKISMATISGSVGYIMADNDNFANTDQAIAYSIQCALALEKNFSIIPTILFRDHMKSAAGGKQGTDLYAGVTFSGSFK